MNGLITGALVALSMFQQTDTTFAVGTADRLSVETLGGSITVETWDEDRIRVRGDHSTRTYIDIDHGRRTIQLESEARRGPANLVDFRITVPRRFALDLEAQQGDIVVDGSDGAIEAETVQGDVTIRGGRGSIKVSATMGSIRVDGADGRIEIESAAADIRVARSSGEIYAETAGGTIVLEDVSPTVVDVGSTGGRVYYAGGFQPGGSYFFGAHGGSITIVVPEGTSASFNVATVYGSITSNLAGETESLRSGRRHTFEIGGGGALVEAETYGGRVRLLRSGTEGSAAPNGSSHPNREDHLAWGSAHITDHVTAEVTPRVTAEVTPRVTAEITPRITAEVTPRITAEITPRLTAEITSRMNLAQSIGVRISREMSRGMPPRVEPWPAPTPTPATIRK